jgi:hypothetical protein
MFLDLIILHLMEQVLETIFIYLIWQMAILLLLNNFQILKGTMYLIWEPEKAILYLKSLTLILKLLENKFLILLLTEEK